MLRCRTERHCLLSDHPPESSTVIAGKIQLAPDSGELRVEGRTVLLSTPLSQLLRVLMENHRRVVTRRALMMAMWGTASPQRAVELDEQVTALRCALGDDAAIETVLGIGYRLI
jgi:DNA-binding winged helix-turn-helix (wHTH) protein